MKKLLIGLLAVLSTLCVFSACDSEDTPPATSNLSMEGGFWYSFEEDAYTITGYEGTNTEIVIPDTYNGYPVTSIGEWAFYYRRNLTSVTIPDSVTSIGNFAFYFCDGLTNMIIPDSVTNIGYSAFYHCDSLTSVEIPDSVTSIGDGAFYGCRSLTSVNIPDAVTSIGERAFAGCSSLEEITIPFVGGVAGKTADDSYQHPFGYIFGTLSYKGGEAVEQYYYGSSTSSETSTTYYIPSSLSKVTVTGGDILYGAFYDCDSLTSVNIPDSVTSIGREAFSWCDSLTSVTIGKGVTSIGREAFYGCYKLIEVKNLSTLDITAGSEDYGYVGYYAKRVYKEGEGYLSTDRDGYIIYDDGTDKLLMGYTGTETDLTLPSGITKIYQYAFYGCDSLTSVTIGNGVTSIGEWAFYGCDSLTSVTFVNPNGWWVTQDSTATSGTDIASSDLPTLPPLRNT